MHRRALCQGVLAKPAGAVQLFAAEDEALLVWWDPFFILHRLFHLLNSPGTSAGHFIIMPKIRLFIENMFRLPKAKQWAHQLHQL